MRKGSLISLGMTVILIVFGPGLIDTRFVGKVMKVLILGWATKSDRRLIICILAFELSGTVIIPEKIGLVLWQIATEYLRLYLLFQSITFYFIIKSLGYKLKYQVLIYSFYWPWNVILQGYIGMPSESMSKQGMRWNVQGNQRNRGFYSARIWQSRPLHPEHSYKRANLFADW